MPRREIGLMGYVGEAVVAYWLRRHFPSREFEISGQVRPAAVPAKGGPYLDFGVLRNGAVEAVFEVKSQDYIFNGGVNRSLRFLWKHRGEMVEFVFQDGHRAVGHGRTEAYLVLLVPPNEYGIRDIGKENLGNVVLFEDMWGALGGEPVSKSLLAEQLLEDTEKVLAILHSPNQGGSLREEFLRLRGRIRL